MRGVLILLFVALLGDPAQAPASRFVTVSDRLRIHYLEAGAGTPVILHHGSAGTAASNYLSTGILQALAANHCVLALDFRGQGRSDRPVAPYASDRYPQDILEIMDRLGVEKAHLSGYSMGGEMMAPLLAIAPERIITAAFGGSGLLDPERQVHAAALAQDPKGRDRAPPPLARALKGRDHATALADPGYKAALVEFIDAHDPKDP